MNKKRIQLNYDWTLDNIFFVVFLSEFCFLETYFVEEIILGEDRTTEEERMHIMEGWWRNIDQGKILAKRLTIEIFQ